MPRYDYRCVSCGHDFELRQSFKEAGSGTCPVCSGQGQRVYHAVPVIYKGSGFYTTDYGRPKAPAEKETSDSKESKSASEAKESNTEKATTGSGSSSDSAAKSTSDSTT